MTTERRRPVWGNTLRRDLDFNEYGGENLGKFLRDLLKADRWRELEVLSAWTSTVTNTGVTGVTPPYAYVSTGVQSNSSARRQVYAYTGITPGNFNQIDFSKRIVAVILFGSEGIWSANGQAWFGLLERNIAGDGDPTVEAIGIRIDGNALKGIVHDGSSLTVVDLGVSIVGTQADEIVIESDGTGNVEWFFNGVSKGWTSSGPAGAVTNSTGPLMAVKNNDDDENNLWRCWEFKVYAEA